LVRRPRRGRKRAPGSWNRLAALCRPGTAGSRGGDFAADVRSEPGPTQPGVDGLSRAARVQARGRATVETGREDRRDDGQDAPGSTGALTDRLHSEKTSGCPETKDGDQRG